MNDNVKTNQRQISHSLELTISATLIIAGILCISYGMLLTNPISLC